MPANQVQKAWITSVLGVKFAAKIADADLRRLRGMWESTRTIWFRASEQADAQLAALQNALRGSDDEDYQAVAELGLNAVTGNNKVRLLAAIQEIDGASGQPDPGQVSKLRQVINSFIAHLADDPHVDAVDTNDLGVSVRIADTLIPALEELDAAVEQWQRAAR